MTDLDNFIFKVIKGSGKRFILSYIYICIIHSCETGGVTSFKINRKTFGSVWKTRHINTYLHWVLICVYAYFLNNAKNVFVLFFTEDQFIPGHRTQIGPIIK